MLTKHTLDSIQSGSEPEVYSHITNAALYMATGGFLEQANQLLSELWKYRLPHDRNTWLADTAFMVLWEAAGSRPGFIPFPLDNIDSIEKNMRGYIAMDKWAYKMPDKPWNELTGQDLLRQAFITAAMVKGDGSRPLGLETIMNPPPATPANEPGGLSAEYLDKITQYISSLSVQASDRYPSSQNEMEALAMLEKLAAEEAISCEGFALGAELAARHGKTDTAIHLAKIWASGYHKNYLGYSFPLLASGRHVASLLLQKVVAEELHLSEPMVREFLSQAIAVLDQRLQHGRSLVYGDLSWKELLFKISHASIALNEGEHDEAVRHSGWIGFEGATTDAIALAEKRLGVTLPEDYKLFLQTTNGFRSFPLNNPSLLPVDQIDFIGNIVDAGTFRSLLDWPGDENDPETFEDYVSRGIMISRYPDEQMVWLIPSIAGGTTSWQAWFFAYWVPGEQRYPGFRYYMEDQLQSIED